MRFGGVILAGALAAITLRAQSLEIYSEFQRVDPFGNIVPIDRSEHPREILSPAVARNAFASFHVVVSVPPNTNYFLYVVSNPLDACRVALYKEHFVKTGDVWIPDTLAEVHRLPDFGAMPDPDEDIPGQNTRVYLLDLWIPPEAIPGRFRLEAQLKVGHWIVRPMEVRVVPARVPDGSAGREPGRAVTLPRIEEGADAAAAAALRDYLAGKFSPAPVQTLTVRDIIRRNAIQDMALAGSLDPQRAGPEALGKLWKGRPPRTTLGAEWYLRIRDFVCSEAQRAAR
ncbi:MAG: hypothetical protein ABSH44_24585 [Bryobacteraceae bacterium]|jgi:hypothetical protein